jgi:hypothetical protein
MWYQGLDQSPPLVQTCIQSWRRFNPDWELIVLDRNNLTDWIDPEEVPDNRRDLTIQNLSDLARLSLLKRYGGVWVDATVVCLRPLVDWFESYPDRFFAFRSPGRDRLLSTWFIAADSDDALLDSLHHRYSKFMTSQNFVNQNTELGKFIVRQLTPILNRSIRRTTWWLSPYLQFVVRARPYFILHYAFNSLILERPELAARWNETSLPHAKPMHMLQTYAKEAGGLTKALAGLETDEWPLQKLSWSTDVSSPYWHEVMRHLGDTKG